jgi:hypothetical protein
MFSRGHHGLSHCDHTIRGRVLEGEETRMDVAGDDVGQLDDFQVIAERIRVSDAITALIDRYRKLNEEMGRRMTLRWMLP